jgi:hypothetical protein
LEGAGAVKARESWRVARKQLLRAMEGAAMFVRSLAGLWFAIRMSGPKMAFVAVACDQPCKSRRSKAAIGGALRASSAAAELQSLLHLCHVVPCSLLVNINIELI